MAYNRANRSIGPIGVALVGMVLLLAGVVALLRWIGAARDLSVEEGGRRPLLPRSRGTGPAAMTRGRTPAQATDTAADGTSLHLLRQRSPGIDDGPNRSGPKTNSTVRKPSDPPPPSLPLPPPHSLPPPLHAPIDYQQYTIRINSWKRPEQLHLSIQHFRSCVDTVALVQVVWCTAQGDIPPWLFKLELEAGANATTTHSNQKVVPVVVERHTINSLNERFRILSPIPTAAVLSVDDDVLRPCIALDATFVKWTHNPHRMVGFDARTIEHDANTLRWKYGYKSTTERTNMYALTLSRFAFVHQHYLQTYMVDAPAPIRTTIDQHFNCEDIALSLWVSYQTSNHAPPLLADVWAMQTQLKLHSGAAISATKGHKAIRDDCVHNFAQLLNLDPTKLLAPLVYYHHPKQHNQSTAVAKHLSRFDCGASLDASPAAAPEALPWSDHLRHVLDNIQIWKDDATGHQLRDDLNGAVRTMARQPYEAGYLQGTAPWKAKFGGG